MGRRWEGNYRELNKLRAPVQRTQSYQRQVHFSKLDRAQELYECRAAVLGSSASLIVRMVSVDVKQH